MGVTRYRENCILRAEMMHKVELTVNRRMNSHQAVRMACPPASWSVMWLVLILVIIMGMLVWFVMASAWTGWWQWGRRRSRRRKTSEQERINIAIIRVTEVEWGDVVRLDRWQEQDLQKIG